MSGPRIIQRHLPHGPASQNPPRGIVVHSMAYRLDMEDGEEPRYAASFLDEIGLSAHALVAPDGTIIRCRDDLEGAWHAKGFNYDTLGIEVLTDGTHTYDSWAEAIADPWWPTQRQVQSAARQVADWLDQYPIEWVRRHSDVDPDRKIDPGGGFPWDRFCELAGVPEAMR